MCGIAGVFAYRDAAPPVNIDELVRVRDAMAARGPDGAGLWVAGDRRIGLAHRRLTIIDLTDAGAQPMATADGRYLVTFNGEIYNYRALKSGLERKGYRFHSNCDTEVLLHMYAEHGPEMVHALRGMYAFGIWDARDQSLFLARDPFGIKPLYYADDGASIRFASQVKALLRGGNVDGAPEPAGSVGFLIWGSVPEPYTIYRGIRALPAGTHMRVSRGGKPATTRFFDITDEFRKAEDAPPAHSSRTKEILRDGLADSVRHHLVSDVPVGLFLSAGIDSTVLAGLAVEQGRDALKAITLGFPEFQGTGNDEVPLAAAFAERVGIRHESQRVNRNDFDAELDQILEAMDQPSIDGINTYFVSRAAARAGMRVAISGLGGDELFGGYPSFSQVPSMARRLAFSQWLPGAGRCARWLLAPLASAVTSPKYASLLEYGGTYGGAYLLRRALFMPWEARTILDPATVSAGLGTLQTLERLQATVAGLRTPRSRVAALELSWYMRNQLLRDADWAAMVHSVEIRVPFLDVELFRMLAPLIVSDAPPAKPDIARVLQTPLSNEILARPKTGFRTPVSQWLTTPKTRAHVVRGMRGWARQVLPPQPRLFAALMLATDAPGQPGGIAKFNADLLSAVTSMRECAQVTVAARNVSALSHRSTSRLRVLTRGAKSKLRYVLDVLQEVALRRVDVIIVGHINLAPLGAALAVLLRVPSILLIYGIEAWRPHRHILVRASLWRFTTIAGISHFTLSRFSSWAKLDVSNLYYLPPAVDLRQYFPGPRQSHLVDRLGLNNRTVLMTLGRLDTDERYKGFDEIIEALPAMAQHVPDVTYLICGDGTDRRRLEEKARRLNVRERVVFAGFVPEEEKADHYRLADVYVMPGRGEGFGVVILEALACGLPVIASRLDGSREAVLNGAIGFLVDPSDSADLVGTVLLALERGASTVPEALGFYSREAFAVRTENLLRPLIPNGLGRKKHSTAA